jgi:S1-C subfamily serine protease
MAACFRPVSMLVSLVLLAPAARAADDTPTKAELSKIGKASTGLVECTFSRGKGYGTAFCIHASGLFVTNQHVVTGGGDASSIVIVLDPSLKTQRVLTAKVLRVDKELDLALLQVVGAKDLKALPWARSRALPRRPRSWPSASRSAPCSARTSGTIPPSA